MNDSCRVRGCECVGDLNRVFQDFLEREPLVANQLTECLAGHVLHRDEVDSIGGIDIVDVNDIRVT